MSWDSFIYFSMAAVLLWAIGAYAAWRDNHPLPVFNLSYRWLAYAATLAGLLVFFSFIILFWISLERPPLRTMGETRLWYSFFLPLAGLMVYSRWKYKWILSFSTLLALVFICVNLFKPEIHSKTLMPALQSPWFAPHVIVYMFAYALLGAATLMALFILVKGKSLPDTRTGGGKEFEITDNLVYIGFAFMTFGMLFGALWAKEAWGHYWSWDPKETWAAITWFSYLVYIHYRNIPHHKERLALWMLLIAFVLLQMCWWGINYLPSAIGSSVHTYS
ncbi:MAG: cytochrome c biogenesis protein CcsA [Bacteroidaceae bacterium]|jgi:ABC-type transport system involved in cytochrome c biogenesis permease subunit|nr:cytochrome c biogenesis protein CcsA [Bacteroidaceae bacterium]